MHCPLIKHWFDYINWCLFTFRRGVLKPLSICFETTLDCKLFLWPLPLPPLHSPLIGGEVSTRRPIGGAGGKNLKNQYWIIWTYVVLWQVCIVYSCITLNIFLSLFLYSWTFLWFKELSTVSSVKIVFRISVSISF